MKNNIVVMLLLLSVLLSSLVVFVPRVSAGAVVIENWDSYNLGAVSGVGTYSNWIAVDTGGDSLITATGSKNGKCLLIDGSVTNSIVYINFTYAFSYLSSICMYFNLSNGMHYVRFYNSSGLVCYIYFVGGDGWYYDPVDVAGVSFSVCSATEDGWLNVTHVVDNVMNYSWYNKDTGVVDSNEGASYVTSDWTSITQIRIDCDGGNKAYLDDIIIDTSPGVDTNIDDTDVIDGTFYFNFYDAETLEELGIMDYSFYDGGWGDSFIEDGDEFVVLGFYSPDLWSGNYLVDEGYCTPDDLPDGLPVITNFTEGEYYTFYLTGNGSNIPTSVTNIIGYRNGVQLYYKPKILSNEYRLKIYSGQSYNIYLEPITFSDDGVFYSYSGGSDISGWGVEVSLTDDEYLIGETMRIRYRLPSASWLYSNGYDTNGWKLRIFDTEDYAGIFGRLTGAFPTDSILDFDVYPTGDYDYINYEISLDDGFNDYYSEYEIVIQRVSSNWWDSHRFLFDGLKFYVSDETFVPSATISSITPNPAYMGQSVSIAFTANAQGFLQVKQVATGSIVFSIPFQYKSSAHIISKSFNQMGLYSFEVYVDPINSTPCDTDSLTVVSSNTSGQYGYLGYGVPYLYIPEYRIIAGNGTVTIYYRTYLNNSELILISPRGEQSGYSTTVSNSTDNILTFDTDNNMPIGTWNVTLYGGDVNGNFKNLTSSFNIVNEEGNWVEFTKNVYTTNDNFELIIKHTYRISLTFYKDDVAQGRTIILDFLEYPNDKYIVSMDEVSPDVGDWRVEMYRINNYNRVYELAEWSCSVIYAKPISAGGEDTYLGLSSVVFMGLMGFVVFAVFLIFGVFIGNKVRNDKVASISVGSFAIVGIVIPTLLTWFPLWGSFLLALLIVGIIVLTFKGK